jgi:hypothetical protein
VALLAHGEPPASSGGRYEDLVESITGLAMALTTTQTEVQA